MEWELFETFDDRYTAEMLAELFRNNNIPTRIDYGALASGVDGFRIYIMADLAHRARWITAGSRYSEEELSYLATGSLSNETDDDNELAN